jgi:topoisomerase-4 subunit A
LLREKEYDLSKSDNSRLLYLSINPNGEAETIKVTLKPRPRVKNLVFDVEFSATDIKGRNSIGNILTRFPVHKIELKIKGTSTLGGKKVWWDGSVKRLNDDCRGELLGEFSGKDKILVMTKSGIIRLTGPELSAHFEEDVLVIRKFDPSLLFTVVYYDGEQKFYYVKRFQPEASEKPARFFEEHPKTRFVLISVNEAPKLEIKFGGKHKKRDPEVIAIAEFIAVKSFKARGKRLSTLEIASITELEPLKPKKPEDTPEKPDPKSPKRLPDPKTAVDKPDTSDGIDKGEQMSLF